MKIFTLTSLLIVLVLLAAIGCGFSSFPLGTVRNSTEQSPQVADVTRRSLMLAWNIEAAGSDTHVIQAQLRSLEALTSFNMVLLSGLDESYPQIQPWLSSFADAGVVEIGKSSRFFYKQTCYQLEAVEPVELKLKSEGGFDTSFTAQLITLLDKAYDQDFSVLVPPEVQEKEHMEDLFVALNNWSRTQTQPTVMIGNWDVEFDNRGRRGGRLMQVLTTDQSVEFNEPRVCIDSHWQDANGDGKDDVPDTQSIFCFAIGEAQTWSLDNWIVSRKDDFPDNDTTSCYRPMCIELRY